MNAPPAAVRRRFEQVRQCLVDGGALPSNALQLACPGAPDAIVPRLLRPACVVPEGRRVADLLRELQLKRAQSAVVVDERRSFAEKA